MFDALTKAVTSFKDELFKPKSFKDGEEFERYVKNVLFPSTHYDLVHETPSYKSNQGRYIESSLNPDFKFRCKESKREFWLEAKHRSTLFNSKLTWCNDAQLKRYNEVNKTLTVLIAIGFIDTSDETGKSDYIALAPVSEFKYTGLFPKFAKGFQIGWEAPVSARYLNFLLK